MGSSVSSDARTVGIPQNGFVLLLLAGTLWGTGGPVARVLQLDLGVGPMAVGTYRLLIAGSVITAFLLVSGRLRRLQPSAPLVRRLALNAVLHAIFQVLFFASFAFIPAGLSALVKIGSVPVFITIGVCWLYRRPTVAGSHRFGVCARRRVDLLDHGFGQPDPGGGARPAGQLRVGHARRRGVAAPGRIVHGDGGACHR